MHYSHWSVLRHQLMDDLRRQRKYATQGVCIYSPQMRIESALNHKGVTRNPVTGWRATSITQCHLRSYTLLPTRVGQTDKPQSRGTRRIKSLVCTKNNTQPQPGCRDTVKALLVPWWASILCERDKRRTAEDEDMEPQPLSMPRTAVWTSLSLTR